MLLRQHKIVAECGACHLDCGIETSDFTCSHDALRHTLRNIKGLPVALILSRGTVSRLGCLAVGSSTTSRPSRIGKGLHLSAANPAQISSRPDQYDVDSNARVARNRNGGTGMSYTNRSKNALEDLNLKPTSESKRKQGSSRRAFLSQVGGAAATIAAGATIVSGAKAASNGGGAATQDSGRSQEERPPGRRGALRAPAARRPGSDLPQQPVTADRAGFAIVTSVDVRRPVVAGVRRQGVKRPPPRLHPDLPGPYRILTSIINARHGGQSCERTAHRRRENRIRQSGRTTWLTRPRAAAPVVRAAQESQVERPEHHDDTDVDDQPRPELVPEERDVQADDDGDHHECIHEERDSAHHFHLLRGSRLVGHDRRAG